VGVTRPPVSPRAPVVSYTTFSPSPGGFRLPYLSAGRGTPAVCFSVALFRQVAPTWDYPAPCPVEPGLSSSRAWDATACPTWAVTNMIAHPCYLSTKRVTESHGPATWHRGPALTPGARSRRPSWARIPQKPTGLDAPGTEPDASGIGSQRNQRRRLVSRRLEAPTGPSPIDILGSCS